jgi:DNA-binding transcriptional MerR regulator
MRGTLDREEQQVKGLFDRVERLEKVAGALADKPEAAAELRLVAVEQLRAAGPVRMKVAASLLSLSDRTVRTWVDEGVLTEVGGHSIRRLDPVRLHQVLHLVRELRDAGRNRDLIDAVWYRLQDVALLEREDLRESLEQMRRGELRPAGTKAEEEAEGNGP